MEHIKCSSEDIKILTYEQLHDRISLIKINIMKN